MLKCLLRSWVSALLKVCSQAAVLSISDAGLHGSACSQPSHNQSSVQANLGLILPRREKRLWCRKLCVLDFSIGRLREMQLKKMTHSCMAPCTLNKVQTSVVGYLTTRAWLHPKRLSIVSKAPSSSSRSGMQTEVWFSATAEKTFKLDKPLYSSSALRVIFCQRYI